MGRGRQKAKQTKVARELKYRSLSTDFASLEEELRTSSNNIPPAYADLASYIWKSFQHDQQGLPLLVHTDAQYGPDDAFYEAVGRYSLFHTCNTWANNALKSCGQRACLWTAFDEGIFYQYRSEN